MHHDRNRSLCAIIYHYIIVLNNIITLLIIMLFLIFTGRACKQRTFFIPKPREDKTVLWLLPELGYLKSKYCYPSCNPCCNVLKTLLQVINVVASSLCTSRQPKSTSRSNWWIEWYICLIDLTKPNQTCKYPSNIVCTEWSTLGTALFSATVQDIKSVPILINIVKLSICRVEICWADTLDC